jgi:hypothetical protein
MVFKKNKNDLIDIILNKFINNNDGFIRNMLKIKFENISNTILEFLTLKYMFMDNIVI